ncbi:hypothetical protein [Nonomuraea guangzhouensis]|uniref:Uncharacterized protein n=1 Tax=Nonomuraea guangzhouensis TaxID=1291555 RepID=A0ABW4GE41_9ACTN|nr:hypothetical protein [Nonomuraea guangzhouensis]
MIIRRGLLALVLISIMGAALELAAERHWQTLQQLLPWGALAVLTLALALLAVGRPQGAVTTVRVLALAVLLVAAFGVYAHVSANYDAGLLDQRYADTWDALSPLTRWWYAVSKSVGAAPPLAPGMLAQSALLLLLATLTRTRTNADTPTPVPSR